MAEKENYGKRESAEMKEGTYYGIFDISLFSVPVGLSES